MAYTELKLNYLLETKEKIREAIEAKGQAVADKDTFRSYAEKIAVISGGSVEGVHFVTFMSEDGSTELYKRPVADGDDCADPVIRGLIAEPEKESTAQYNYTHVGWSANQNGALDSNILKAVTADKTVYANFAAVIRYYTVTYLDDDGTALKTESLAYGTMPSYKPTKDGYDFVEWTPKTAVTGDTSYTAVWKAKAAFGTASWADIISVAQSGNAASTFALGDERTETITYADGSSEQITWVVVSFNKTVSCVDGGKDNMTISAKHALATKRRIINGMNGYYESSELATYLNETIFNALPMDLQNGIKEVYTFSKNYASQKIWIPALYDLGLSKTNFAAGNSTGPLEYFDTSAKRTMKQGANGSAVEYWTRSRYSSGNYTYYAVVKTDGSVSGSNTLPNSNYGVVPCFCI